jgi:hypothetical protein
MHLFIMPYSEETPAFTALMYLLSVARSTQPEQTMSMGNPRSYAPWSVQEEQLVWCLWQAMDQTSAQSRDGYSHVPGRSLIAKLVQRTTTSIKMKTDALGNGPPKLETLPQSRLPITRQDIELLTFWAEEKENKGEALYDRDALAWRYGQPLDRATWTIGEKPTLRVVEVEWADELLPGASEAFGTEWRDQVNAANAAWVDLAVQVGQERDSLILYTGADPHGARLTALRSALKRHGRHDVPRQRVRHATPEVLAQLEANCPDLILLYEPEQWSPQVVQALKARTVIVVVPFFQSPDGQSVLSTDDSEHSLGDGKWISSPLRSSSWRPHAPIDWNIQEDNLREFGQGRTVERISQRGIPNTSGTAARIDWPALRHLPESGQVLVANDLLLLRAAIWFQLSTGRRPQVSDPEILTPSWLKGIGTRTSDAVTAIAELHASSLPAAEKIHRRLLFDLFSHRTSSDSKLSLAVSDQPPIVYIGH